jgi:hypothetical protein
MKSGWLALCMLSLLPTTLTASESAPVTDQELLTAAEQAFIQGIEHRDDADQARPAFARAAASYDELWRRSHRSPELALNRARARRLAGDLPRAIVALHEGLAAVPWSRPLQVALEDARSAVAYSPNSATSTQCRPPVAVGISTRMSPLEAWLLGGLLWGLVFASATRFTMTRQPLWLAFGVVGLLLLVIMGSLWSWEHRLRERENAHPIGVLTEDVVLRKGNSDTYPVKLEGRLPRGVELRLLNERGGWFQVQLADGSIGWVPRSVLLRVTTVQYSS